MSIATTTIRPGELRAEQLQGAPLPAWVPIVDHVLERLPAFASKIGKAGPGGHLAGLWVAVVVLAVAVVVVVVALVLHVAGDGTLRDQVDRTECHVEWLVERAVAEDRGQPPPPFSPLGCDR